MKKSLFTYWHQGFDEAPEIIQHCIRSMKSYHPDWTIHLLDQHTVEDFIELPNIKPEILEKMSLAHRSDLLRTQLLIKYGGVWSDPTCFFMQPLDNWLPQHMDAGLFFFHRPGRDRIISNWFIAAEPQHPLLIKLYKELCNYWNSHNFRNLGRPEKSKTEEWLNRIINRNLDWPRIWFHPFMTSLVKLYPYMVYHYKVYDLIQNDEECAEIYSKMNKFSSDIPHKMKRFGLLKPLTNEAKQWVDDERAPIYKLTWKLNSTKIPEGSVLDYLLRSQA